MKAGAIIDLFAGAGGFSLGAHLAGFEGSIALELDPVLSYSLSANFPRLRVIHGDIRDTSPSDLVRAADARHGDIAGVIGGPPCQGFSIIGKRNPRDPRNTLIGEYFRFVKAIRPKFFIFENVPGLLSGHFKRALDGHLESVARSYTIIGPLIVDAADFGAATYRRRVIVIGYSRAEKGGDRAEPCPPIELHRCRILPCFDA